jgi:hypothetical protein
LGKIAQGRIAITNMLRNNLFFSKPIVKNLKPAKVLVLTALDSRLFDYSTTRTARTREGGEFQKEIIRRLTIGDSETNAASANEIDQQPEKAEH